MSGRAYVLTGMLARGESSQCLVHCRFACCLLCGGGNNAPTGAGGTRGLWLGAAAAAAPPAAAVRPFGLFASQRGCSEDIGGFAARSRCGICVAGLPRERARAGYHTKVAILSNSMLWDDSVVSGQASIVWLVHLLLQYSAVGQCHQPAALCPDRHCDQHVAERTRAASGGLGVHGRVYMPRGAAQACILQPLRAYCSATLWPYLCDCCTCHACRSTCPFSVT